MHKDQVKISPTKSKKSSKPKSSNFWKARKLNSKSQRTRYITQLCKWLQTLATNALIGRFAPTSNDYEENFDSLSIDNIWAISAWRNKAMWRSRYVQRRDIHQNDKIVYKHAELWCNDSRRSGSWIFHLKETQESVDMERMESWKKEKKWLIHDARNVWWPHISRRFTKECYHIMSTLAISCKTYRCMMIMDVLQWFKMCSSIIACRS